MCQNVSRIRASVSVGTVKTCFDNFKVSLAGVPSKNIINFDETNPANDPKGKKMLFRKGCKHPIRVMNTSKSSISLMFPCTASGLLPYPYVVYKAQHLMDSWV